VPALLTQLDAFIYSSDHDTFGIAVIEALATGIPVFVNDWGVMKEITDNGRYANLYRSKDESDLLNKFLLFLEQPEAFKKAALENAIWARKTYSIQNHMERLYEVYRGIC
jgi:glycosyltransferase involved in cell wall biosynthesis